MDIFEIVKIGIVLTAGSIIQSSSGFGFGLFAIPLLLFFGLNLPAAVTIVVIGSAIQKVFAIISLWKAVDWKEMLPFMTIGLLSLPLGVYFMYGLTSLDQSSVKQVIGFCVFVLLILQWKGVLHTGDHIRKIWGYLAGFFSGFFNGLANIGGPPLVLWILAHRWPNEKMRVTPIAFSLIFVPFQLLLMFLAFGPAVMGGPVWKAALSLPFIFVGTGIGLKIGGKISKENLRVYMGVLLLFVALAAALGPFFS